MPVTASPRPTPTAAQPPTSTATLTGYEANLVAWYPLLSDFDNHAVTTWDLGRDYNPYNPSISQGPWSLGVITGDSTATGNFNATAFQALTASPTSSLLTLRRKKTLPSIASDISRWSRRPFNE